MNPIDSITLRLLVKEFLDRRGKNIKKFNENLPGRDCVWFFKTTQGQIGCLNVLKHQAFESWRKTPEANNTYFDEPSHELKDVSFSNIVNYDETNLTDDPGKRKIITRRGTKYPEKILY